MTHIEFNDLYEEAVNGLAHRADLLVVCTYLSSGGGVSFGEAMRESRRSGELSVLRTARELLQRGMSEIELEELHQSTEERISELEAEIARMLYSPS